MRNGIINIYKERGYTSHDVVAKLRGILKERRIGHTGTLDPDATGVLPVCVGAATKACELLLDKDKEYEAVLLLGVETDTQDISGKVRKTRTVTVSEEEAINALMSFVGTYEQVPPMYSALKVDGRKLCEFAREGKTVERVPRPVTIYSLEVLDTSFSGGTGECGEKTIRFRVTCSKGTYIRTLCHDLGQALGCGGCMASLRRTMACGFALPQAVTLEQVQQAADRGEAEDLLLPVDSLFAHHPALTLKAPAEKKVRNGVSLSTPKLKEGEYRVYGESGSFLALSRCERGRLVTVKSFFEPADLSL